MSGRTDLAATNRAGDIWPATYRFDLHPVTIYGRELTLVQQPDLRDDPVNQRRNDAAMVVLPFQIGMPSDDRGSAADDNVQQLWRDVRIEQPQGVDPRDQ